MIKPLAIAAVLSALLALPIAAQEPADGADRQPPHERVMQRLQRENPAEHQRLQELRRTDPTAFHRELQTLMRNRRQQDAPRDGRRGQDGEARHDYSRVLMHIKETQPEQYDQLVALRENDPRAFRQAMRAWFRENFPEYRAQVFGKEAESLDVARRYHAADDAAKAALEAELITAVEEAFDERLTLQKQRLAQMEQQLATLRAQLAEREAKRQEIIDARVDELKTTPPATTATAP